LPPRTRTPIVKLNRNPNSGKSGIQKRNVLMDARAAGEKAWNSSGEIL
jgi:hypothetical protein